MDTPKPEAVNLDREALEVADRYANESADIKNAAADGVDSDIYLLAGALLRTARRVEEAERRAEDLTPLARLGMEALDRARDTSDYDSGDIQSDAKAFGVVAAEARPGSCDPDNCPCDEYNDPDEPRECYRDTDATRRAKALLASDSPSPTPNHGG